MIRVFIVLCGLVLGLSACSTPRVGEGNPSLNVVSTISLPQPTRSDMTVAKRLYLIGAFDKVEIDVFGVEDLKREVQTDGSGRLSFPLVGVVEAAGLTPAEVASVIEERLRGRYVRDPQVTVNLIETVSQVVTVEGEVRRPGVYPVVGNMSLLRAVATAGGTGENAKLNDVVVFREVDGQRYAGLYNLQSIRRGLYGDPELFANDVVVVGDSKARQLFRDILTLVPLLTTPLILLAQSSGN